MPRPRKPPNRKYTAHQITLDPATYRYARSLIGTMPEVDSLSAVLRHVLRYHQAHAQRPGTTDTTVKLNGNRT